MIEQLLNLTPPLRNLPTGPGPQDLLIGDHIDGYYGTISADEFFTGPELAAAVGTSDSGIPINDNVDWFKVILDGKILYTPQMAIRWGLPYNNLAGLQVIGNESTPKIISKFGKRFRVRLMTGCNPGTIPVIENYPTTNADKSEFNRIIYRLTGEAPVTDMVPKFANYTLLQLGLARSSISGQPAQRVICQELIEGGNCVIRNGNNGIAATNQWTALLSTSRSAQNAENAWRPILELL